MVVRVHPAASIAALAVAAWPFSAQAQESPTPNISCTNPTTGALTGGDGGTVSAINWGDHFGFGAPTISVNNGLPAVQFNCNGSMYSHDVSGSMFSVNFGPIRNSLDLKIFTGEIQYQLLDPFMYNAEGKMVTEFDIYVKVYDHNVDGTLTLDHKDFVAVKIDSAFGDSKLTNLDTPLSMDANGNVILDPSIPGGFGTVELSGTPGNPAPEPATFALFGTGLLAAARALRRKSRR